MKKTKRTQIAKRLEHDDHSAAFHETCKDLKKLDKYIKKQAKRLKEDLEETASCDVAVNAKWNIEKFDEWDGYYLLSLKISYHKKPEENTPNRVIHELPTVITNQNLWSRCPNTNKHFIQHCFEQAKNASFIHHSVHK